MTARPRSISTACCSLGQGRYDEGWRSFEARDWYARLESMLPSPRWRGEPLQDRSLLIGLEAAHGDMIQFCRFAQILKANGDPRIVLICHSALKALFQTLEGVDKVFAVDEAIPALDSDFWTPPLSMQHFCRTRLDSIPAHLPYLHPDRQLKWHWEAELSKTSRPSDCRIGLVWRANPGFENDAERSLPDLGVLSPLRDIAGTRFFSLQKGRGETEAASVPQDLPVVNLGPMIADFADAAAIAANLDLLICVDTAMAHLTGALGKECRALLPGYMTDWRWLKGRTDSPWYPHVTCLCRPRPLDDWTADIREVHREFQAFVRQSRFPGKTDSLH